MTEDEKKELRKRAVALYKAPFKFDVRGGYIWDANHEMVADGLGEAGHMLQVRGWGRISYLPEPGALQDTVGELFAELLTKHWEGLA